MSTKENLGKFVVDRSSIERAVSWHVWWLSLTDSGLVIAGKAYNVLDFNQSKYSGYTQIR